jgi:hypothetical protein
MATKAAADEMEEVDEDEPETLPADVYQKAKGWSRKTSSLSNFCPMPTASHHRTSMISGCWNLMPLFH